MNERCLDSCLDASSQKSGSHPLGDLGQKRHDKCLSANLPQDIEKIRKHDVTWQRGLARPNHESAKTDNPPTHELGNDSTRKLGSSGWAQQQLRDLEKLRDLKRPESTAKPESTGLRAGDGKTTDQPILQKSEEQQTRERELEGRNRLQVDYQRYLRNPIVGF